MIEFLESNPLAAGIAALVLVYIVFKIIGIAGFLFRMGIAVLIVAGLAYHYLH